MAQQSLNTVIQISANANKLNAIGDILTGVGGYVDRVSQKLIGFGKEAVTEYASFDDIMRKVQSVGEMSVKEVGYIADAAREVAKTSRFTAQDAAEAELFLAQVGLGYREIIDLLPDVLNLAQAGDISIASSADYLYSTLKSLGHGLEYADTLIDQIAKTASIGSTDVDTLGESLTRIGSGLQMFKGGAPEVLAILSAMSEYGQDMRGSEGGTRLRNFMLSLIAPTGNGDAIVAMLENIGVSTEEFDEIMEGVDLKSAAKAMKDLGFSAYDENGNLKGGIEIITGLRNSLKGLDEEAQYNALSKIFGKRTLITALNLIKQTDEEWRQLLTDINGSEGYADYMVSIQEGGIGGAIRRLKSQWEELKLTVGEALSPMVEDAAKGLTDIMKSISEMDEGTLNAFVSGLTTVAAAGPALLTLGGLFKLLGFIASPAGALAASTIGLVAFATALKDINEAAMEDNFGTLQMDMEALAEYTQGIGTDFTRALEAAGRFGEQVDSALMDYQSAASEFSGNLLERYLTQTKLTETDKEKLKKLGAGMQSTLIEGFTSDHAESNLFWEALFGGDYSNENLQTAIFNNDDYYGSLIEGVTQEGKELADLLDAAFADGVLSSDENASIQAVIQKMNARAAALADYQNQIELEKLMHKAQTMSYDDALTFSQQIQDARDKAITDAAEQFETERAHQALTMREQVDNGKITQAEMDRQLANYDAQWAMQKSMLSDQYIEPLMRFWETTMGGSDLSGAMDTIGGYADQFLAGGMTGEEINELIRSQYGQSIPADGKAPPWGDQTRKQLGEMLTRIVESYGGYEGIGEIINRYANSGEEMPGYVGQLARLATMEALVNNFEKGTLLDGTPFGWFDGNISYSSNGQHNKDAFFQTLWPFLSNVMLADYERQAWGTYKPQKDGSGGSFDTPEDRGPEPLYAPTPGPQPTPPGPIQPTENPPPMLIQTNLDTSGLESELPNLTATVILSLPDGEEDGTEYSNDFTANALADASVGVPDGAADGTGWAEGFSSTAYATAHVNIVTSGGGVGEQQGDGGGGNAGEQPGGGGGVNKMIRFAEGGRADVPSIFGEAGPEWAIPEEHSDRTARLLDAAREGAGFTWPELIAARGGLNANTDHQPAQIVYAPVINAMDARGVAEVLEADKRRFEEWWEEHQFVQGRLSYQ